MYSAAAVANAFLDLARKDGQKLTNMKLQKLVYIAHGWCLAITGHPLVYDDVFAWQWGPVIKPLYESLKKYGAGVVTEPVDATGLAVDLDSREMAIIRAVWNKYGKYSALQLSAMTHRDETPWSETWAQSHYDVIPDECIKQHYVRLRHERSKSKPAAK